MAEQHRVATPNIFSEIVYEDCPAALDWLARAFGFVRGEVIEGPGGAIAHAQMHLGSGTIMPKSPVPDWGMRGPRVLGGDHPVHLRDGRGHRRALRQGESERCRDPDGADRPRLRPATTSPETSRATFGASAASRPHRPMSRPVPDPRSHPRWTARRLQRPSVVVQLVHPAPRGTLVVFCEEIGRWDRLLRS